MDDSDKRKVKRIRLRTTMQYEKLLADGSYEIPVVLAIAGVVMVAGSLSMNQIVLAQNVPFILLQPLGFLLFFIGSCAEINRSPFDLNFSKSPQR